MVFLIYFKVIKDIQVRKNKLKDNRNIFQFPHIINEYLSISKNKIFMKFFIATVLLMSIEYQFIYYISVRLADHQNYTLWFDKFQKNFSGVEMYGILRVENTFGVVILGILLKKVLSNLTHQTRIFFGITLFTIGYSFLGSNNYFWILILSMLVATLGELIYAPVQQTILALIMDEDNRTKYLAFFGLHQYFSILIAASFILIGGIIPSIVISIIYLLLGILAFIQYKSVFNYLHKNSLLKKRNDTAS